jgi:hypothetical protein
VQGDHTTPAPPAANYQKLEESMTANTIGNIILLVGLLIIIALLVGAIILMLKTGGRR